MDKIKIYNFIYKHNHKNCLLITHYNQISYQGKTKRKRKKSYYVKLFYAFHELPTSIYDNKNHTHGSLRLCQVAHTLRRDKNPLHLVFHLFKVESWHLCEFII